MYQLLVSIILIDLSAAKVGAADLATGKNVVVTFVGTQDQAGNILTPNPAKVTISKGAKDGVKPTVASVTQTDAKELTVVFSEELTAAPTIKVGAETITLVKDKTNPLKYTAATSGLLDGVVTVAIDSFTDLSGEAGDAYSKVYTFTKDAVAPKATSAKVVVGSDNAEYLEITYDKEVAEGKLAISGSYVKDYVTTTLTSADKAAIYASTSSKKVLRVALSSFATVKGATYNIDAVPATAGGVVGICWISS